MRGMLLTLMLLVGAATAQAGEIDRLYVIDCGWAHADDQSRWSPGLNVGVPIDFSDNCYLIHHSSEGYLLWDTGLPDRLVALPEGQTIPAVGLTSHRTQTLLAALAALGVKPADIRYVAISHVHSDHTGNVAEFPDATLIVQKIEFEYGGRQPFKPFETAQKTMLLEGDKDLFGDGSVTAISTPGHTPGHQSLLVRLLKTGNVILSGDVVHFQTNWDNRRVPAFNTDKDQSLDSMDKIAKLMADKHAQFWIGHDKPSSDTRRHAPEFYE